MICSAYHFNSFHQLESILLKSNPAKPIFCRKPSGCLNSPITLRNAAPTPIHTIPSFKYGTSLAFRKSCLGARNAVHTTVAPLSLISLASP